jgi:hypothetical protein
LKFFITFYRRRRSLSEPLQTRWPYVEIFSDRGGMIAGAKTSEITE